MPESSPSYVEFTNSSNQKSGKLRSTPPCIPIFFRWVAIRTSATERSLDSLLNIKERLVASQSARLPVDRLWFEHRE